MERESSVVAIDAYTYHVDRFALGFGKHPEELGPERFVGGRPTPAKLPTAVWINPPAKSDKQKGSSEFDCPEDPQVTSLTHPRSDYPSAGCVPAEPVSVSSDNLKVARRAPLNTRVMPEKIPGVRGLVPDHTVALP